MFATLRKLIPSALRTSSPGALIDRERLALLEQLPRHGIAAEIGTWMGDFAVTILRVTEPAQLYLVDPWRFLPEYPDRWYGGSIAKGQDDMDALAKAVADRFAGDRRVSIRRETSGEFLGALPQGSLDWVYLDGDHSYAAVGRDLRLAWGAVRRGGFVCGDDYHWREDRGAPVRHAVDEFASDSGVDKTLIGNQFIFVKP